MKGEARRKQLLNILSSSNNPVSGGTLAKELNVSRQIIVQDISLLRANGATIFSTNKGYLLQEDRKYSRVFKVYHTDDQVEEELSTIVDAGGQIRDVFVYHKVYGVLKADMGIKSRRDIRAYMEEISTGKSSLLKNVTSGYHYHTIDAESEEILDAIQEELQQKGFLAKLQDYEPGDFWGDQEEKRKKFKNQAEHTSHPGSCYSKRISINSVIFRIFENIRKKQSVTFV